MAVLKCKMCGGNLEFTDGQSYGTCDSCGSTMTLPKANDERILNLFNRANHYRHQNEFDKALATYESILTEDAENAEAYWGCVLARYGIEYVEDSKTHKRIPTCHRVQNDSILADLDYQKTLQYAPDNHAAEIYKEEAERIAEIQKGILNIARNEQPYDVFICYKETDESGKRTIDSTLAQDIYYQLTNEGYKVFFSRITLEDKLGQEYEPYIFAALNSAKVMLVVGTKQEYYNAVWVKNEWARFLEITKRDRNKLIIPCYRDMDAYDLPDELSMFQSQDMGKIGFIQDLIRGINKVLTVKSEAVNTTVVQTTHDYGAEAEALLKRAFLLLEEAEWEKADELLEKVLNINPEMAQAYVGKLMIEVKAHKEDNLANQAIELSKSANYQKAMRFADAKLKNRLEEYNIATKKKFDDSEKTRIEKERAIRRENERKSHLLNISKKTQDSLIIYRIIIFFALVIVGIISMVIPMGTFAVSTHKGFGDYLVFNAILAWAAALLLGFLGVRHKFFYSLEGTFEQQKLELENEAKRFVNSTKQKLLIGGITILCFVSLVPYLYANSVRNENIEKYSKLLDNLQSIDFLTNIVYKNTSETEFSCLTPGDYLDGNQDSEWRYDVSYEYREYYYNGNKNYSMRLCFGKEWLEKIEGVDWEILLGKNKKSDISIDLLKNKYDIRYTNYREGYKNYSGYYCIYNNCIIWIDEELGKIEITKY